MPWLPIYADKNDIESLVYWLNNEGDIAFIVSNGPKSWKAIKEIDHFANGRLCLWHVPSGYLPLLREDATKPYRKVENPWEGWIEERTGFDPTQPYFGPSHPNVIWLDIRYVDYKDKDSIGISSFEWAGNTKRDLGRPASELTVKWWERLRRWVKKSSLRIPRAGPIDGPNPEIWAMESALDKIRSETKRAYM